MSCPPGVEILRCVTLGARRIVAHVEFLLATVELEIHVERRHPVLSGHEQHLDGNSSALRGAVQLSQTWRGRLIKHLKVDCSTYKPRACSALRSRSSRAAGLKECMDTLRDMRDGGVLSAWARPAGENQTRIFLYKIIATPTSLLLLTYYLISLISHLSSSLFSSLLFSSLLVSSLLSSRLVSSRLVSSLLFSSLLFSSRLVSSRLVSSLLFFFSSLSLTDKAGHAAAGGVVSRG
eukprot:519568-Hanusia_phi.AAC.5